MNSIIRPGDILDIRTTRPFILVRTVAEITRTEVLPMEVSSTYNASLAAGEIKVIQEGRDGEQIVTVRTIYENGVLVSEQPINTSVQTRPETRIVEVGTSQTATPDWR